MQLTHKFFIANVVMVLLAIAATSSLCLFGMRREFIRKAALDMDARMNTLHTLLKSKGNEIAVVNGRLAQGDYVINDNFKLPDKIKELFGGASTIFMGNVRVSTNVMKPEGGRATGTTLQGPARDAVFGQGKPYRGEANILGVPYFTAYDPLKNRAGQVVGALYVGEKQSAYLAVYDRLKYVVVLVAAVLAAGFSSISFYIVRKALRPLGRMVSLMRDIASGEVDLTVRLNISAKDEIGEAASYFDQFVNKLQEVMLKVAENAHEVAEVTSQLHDASLQIFTATEEVASQAATVSTAGEQMAATSHDIAGNCNAAADSFSLASSFTTTGAELVMQTIEAVVCISDRVHSTSGQIATAAEEQSSASSEISNNMQQITDLVQTTAESTHETTQAADRLSGLRLLMGQFRLS